MTDLVRHVSLAFVSGVVVEALYALSVLLIGERRSVLAGVMSAAWGLAFIVGINESFHAWIAAGAWCVGLGVGTIVGIAVKRRWETAR